MFVKRLRKCDSYSGGVQVVMLVIQVITLILTALLTLADSDRSSPHPSPLPASSCTTGRPLIIIAHADDEVLFGHPILQTSGQCRPHVVLVTRPSDITTRSVDFLHSASSMNFTHETLGYADGAQNHDFDQDSVLTSRLSSIVVTTSPVPLTTKWSGIYTHGPTGEYGHPQHIVCCQVVSNIVLAMPVHLRPPLYFFEPFIGLTTSDAHLLLSSLYPREALPWSMNWHAKISPWHLYNIAAARTVCSKHGFDLWRANCALLDLPIAPHVEEVEENLENLENLEKLENRRHLRRPLRIGVVHYRHETTPLQSFEVGFRSAMSLLEEVHGYKVVMLNIYDLEGVVPQSEKYLNVMAKFHEVDVMFVKSNWNWIPDQFVKSIHLETMLDVPKVLLISGVAPVPENEQDVHFYDALVYETEWYQKWQNLNQRHSNVHQAFGIDTTIMRRQNEGGGGGGGREEMSPMIVWDLLFVGWMAPWKRLEMFAAKYRAMCDSAKKKGEKRPMAIAIGKLDAVDESSSIVAMLQRDGIIVRSEVPYDELAELIQSAREVYIPSTVQGGGERAVLEAMAMGVRVSVAEDNEKLLELASMKVVPGQMEYADDLHRVLQSLEFGVERRMSSTVEM